MKVYVSETIKTENYSMEQLTWKCFSQSLNISEIALWIEECNKINE